MIECDRISKAVAEYDPDAHEAGIVRAEEQRRQFLELFPRSEWDTMTLDRYALGQPDHRDNLCRWMEFVTSELGSMRGGAASKSLIYYRAGAGEWWFDGDRVEGQSYQAFLLSSPESEHTFRLSRPITHDGPGGAWTMGQRYAHFDRLRAAPRTTAELA